MKTLIGIIVMIALAAQAFAQSPLPADLIGKWKVGAPYNTPGPVGINERQEKLIRGTSIQYSSTAFFVCGVRIAIKKTDVRSRSPEVFLQSYGFLPKLLGLEDETVVDVTINSFDPVKACGNKEGSVGTHLFIGKNGHVVMEVANDYLPLVKQKKQN